MPAPESPDASAVTPPNPAKPPPSLPKRLVMTVLKVGILVAILWYAFSQMPWNDTYMLSEDAEALPRQGASIQRASNGAVVSAELPLPDGPVTIRAADRLTIISELPPTTMPAGNSQVATAATATATTAAGERSGITLRLPDGRVSEMPAAWVSDGGVLIRRPGVQTMVQRVNWTWIIIGFVVFVPGISSLSLRWWLLLRISGIHVPYWTILRLHLLGLFCTSLMPGGTSGDAVKALAGMKYTDRKAEFITLTVLVDRALGMFGVILIAAAMVLVNVFTNFVRMEGVAEWIGLFLLAGVVGAVLYFSSAFRKLIRYDWLLSVLPFSAVIKRIDDSIYTLRERWRQVLGLLGLQVILQTYIFLAFYISGWGLGIFDAHFGHYLTFVPLGYLANALPLTPGGLGLLEGSLMHLYANAGAAEPAQGFMLGLLIRAITFVASLPGALFIVLGFGRQEAAAAFATPGASTPSPLK